MNKWRIDFQYFIERFCNKFEKKEETDSNIEMKKMFPYYEIDYTSNCDSQRLTDGHFEFI